MKIWSELDWNNLAQIAIEAPVIYFIVILYVRIVGKRSTSQMNSFDWIVTVAMGSIVASTIILVNISIVEGAFTILFLLLLQMALTWSVKRFDIMQKLVKSTPQLLFFDGEFLRDNMKQERVLETEVYAVMREHGHKSLDEVYAIVLETNAKLSIIPKDENNSIGFSLASVQGLPDGLKKDLEQQGEKDDTKE